LIHYSDKAERLLRAVMPYLRVKRLQAELALMVLVNREPKGTNTHMEPGAKAMREWCMRMISRLNKGHASPETHDLLPPVAA